MADQYAQLQVSRACPAEQLKGKIHCKWFYIQYVNIFMHMHYYHTTALVAVVVYIVWQLLYTYYIHVCLLTDDGGASKRHKGQSSKILHRIH